MSPYYPTIDEDLARAKSILRTGWIAGGSTFAVFKILESFVEHIEYLHQEREAFHAHIDELEQFKRAAIKLNKEAQRQIDAANVMIATLRAHEETGD